MNQNTLKNDYCKIPNIFCIEKCMSVTIEEFRLVDFVVYRYTLKVITLQLRK
jgi:hypothetical protein